MRRASLDPDVARVLSRRELHYPSEAPATDRSAHLRAASGLAWMRAGEAMRLVVAQDDTSFLALLSPSGEVEAHLELPHSVAGRRVFESRLENKQHKLDLEACASLPDGSVLVVGSGSLSARERVVLVSEHQAVLIALPAFYAALRARRDFAGSELNIEGAAVVGAHLVLANRGNGAPKDGQAPVDAIAMFNLEEVLGHLAGGPVPGFVAVAPADLGAIEGVRLTFTDLTARRGVLYFLASAEASPNTYDDGVVVGAALGRIAGGQVLLCRLVDEHGKPLTDKVEGLAWADPEGASDEVFVVVDRDDPDRPSECLRVKVPASLL